MMSREVPIEANFSTLKITQAACESTGFLFKNGSGGVQNMSIELKDKKSGSIHRVSISQEGSPLKEEPKKEARDYHIRRHQASLP